MSRKCFVDLMMARHRLFLPCARIDVNIMPSSVTLKHTTGREAREPGRLVSQSDVLDVKICGNIPEEQFAIRITQVFLEFR